MKILTKDNRLLTLIQIGEPDKEDGSNRLKCRTQRGGIVWITFGDIACTFGSYAFPL